MSAMYRGLEGSNKSHQLHPYNPARRTIAMDLIIPPIISFQFSNQSIDGPVPSRLEVPGAS